MTRAHPDPFLRSMALWTLKQHQAALSTLLIGNAGTQHSAHEDDARDSKEADPNVFNFYVYLRTHPLLVRQNKAKSAQKKVWLPNGKQIVIEESITPLERQLYFTTAHGHFRAGCPALALEVLSKLPYVVTENNKQTTPITETVEKYESKASVAQIFSGTLSWDSKPEVDEKASALDWGAPSTDFKTRTDDLELKWSDDEKESDSDDSDGGIKINVSENVEEPKEDVEEASSQQVDIMAQQLKFVACLKILMEELSTLATGFEVDGGQLRYQLYIWLEREVEALRELCNYTSSDASDPSDLETEINESTGMELAQRPSLHELLIQEKLDFEAKVRRAAKRKRWLRGRLNHFCEHCIYDLFQQTKRF